MTGGFDIPRQEPDKTQHKARSRRHRDREPGTGGSAPNGFNDSRPEGTTRSDFPGSCACENRVEGVLGIRAGLPQGARDCRDPKELLDADPRSLYPPPEGPRVPPFPPPPPVPPE